MFSNHLFDHHLVKVCLAAAFAIGLAACSSSSDDTAAVEPPPPPPPAEEPEPAPPSDLETTQAAAMAAAEAAKAASDAAGMAADGAEAATENLATLQTGQMAAMHAMAASDAAATAMAEYMKAKAASDAAAAAELASEAGMALADAEAAQMAAEAAQETAEAAAEMATDAAAMELMIDGTVKSVGDSSVDAMAGPSSEATGSGADAKTVITGLIASMNPMGTSGPIVARDYTPAVEDDLSTVDIEEAVDAMPYRQAASARTFAIGKTLDSSDDMARLMIVTHYAGTNTVRVFSPGDGSTAPTGTRAGYITVDDNDATNTDTNNTALRSEGMFVPVSGGTAGTLASSDNVAADAEAVAVFSYVPPTGATNAGVRQYATLTMSSTNESTGVTTYTYNSGADITAANAAPDGPDAATDLDEAQVAVPIPGPEAYEHIHFGVWAGLGDANAAGAQDLSGTNIGFLQSIGDGMTSGDMPNAGTVTYSGNWVAVVLQGAGDDSGALENGAASLSANLDDMELTASLTGLVTLEGTIDGSAFEGTMATVAADNTYGLTPGAGFEGSFSGGFYGAGAAEAGGVFDFSSDGSGAFLGAFGGVQDD